MKWQKPEQGYTKCNLDTKAFWHWHVPTRHTNCLFIKARTCYFNGLLKPVEVEVFGLYKTLQLITEVHLQNIVFETNCKLITHIITTVAIGLNPYHWIPSNCRQLLSPIPNSRVSYARRWVNLVAYNLRRTSRFNANIDDLDCIPFCISQMLWMIMIWFSFCQNNNSLWHCLLHWR